MFEIFKYLKIKKQCREYTKKLNFDMSELDNQISDLAQNIYQKHKSKFKTFKQYNSKIGFWASTLYDVGGHTPCLVNLADSMFEQDKLFLFLSKKNQTFKKAPKTMQKLNNICQIQGVNYNGFNFVNSLIKGYNQIVENAPKVIILYIAQCDIYSTALIYLLKKYANIKFAFFNHASHYPNLAMTMADVILEGMNSTVKITKEKRHLNNCQIIGLQSKRKEDIKYYSNEEILNKKQELNIPQNTLLTISGGSSYKYFDTNKSPHYEMIKRLLEKTPNLYHLAITDLNKVQKEIIDNIFKDNKNLKKRLIFYPLTPQYDLLFQCGDLFIDSFPMSSAMTQIDLMAMKIPTVVKVNLQNPTWSFHEYMPQNYRYMYEKVEDMEDRILYLLKNENERKRLAENNYEFWLENYESNAVKKKYLDIFDNLNVDMELINFLKVPYEIQLETRNWRNSQNVAKWFKLDYIDETTHKKWLDSLKKDYPKNIAFLIRYNGDFIGVTYFHSIDYNKKEADWGIYIHKENMRNLGIGTKVLEKSIEYAFDNLKFKKIYLDVHKFNETAKKIYLNKGFKCFSENSDFLRMKLINNKEY